MHENHAEQWTRKALLIDQTLASSGVRTLPFAKLQISSLLTDAQREWVRLYLPGNTELTRKNEMSKLLVEEHPTFDL